MTGYCTFSFFAGVAIGIVIMSVAAASGRHRED